MFSEPRAHLFLLLVSWEPFRTGPEHAEFGGGGGVILREESAILHEIFSAGRWEGAGCHVHRI